MANRLGDSSSLYLRQHKDNPVAWQPWDAAAINEAKRRNVPILLSIGYSSCHWCHVMAHECFENEDIARQMNEGFVCIKVDREQRPDLDAVYQAAVQALTGRGGWPLTVFLTPAGEPFYGGTYFPPEERHGLPGLPQLLAAISEGWRQRPDVIRRQAAQLLTVAHCDDRLPGTQAKIDLHRAGEYWLQQFDDVYGGFGTAPKFPQAPQLEMLLTLGTLLQREDMTAAVHVTLTAMAGGGIHDAIGGGFHRYSVDECWRLPHFEKMLYDNAQLLALYAMAHSQQPKVGYAHVARGIVTWLTREMMGKDGCFYAAQDADNEEGEGCFYTWSAGMLRAALSSEEYALISHIYDIREAGNVEGRSVLYQKCPVSVAAQSLNLPLQQAEAMLAAVRQKLYALRQKRPLPQTDNKILADWNALAIAALAEAGARLGESAWLDMAARCADALLAQQSDGKGGIFHARLGTRVEAERFADDAALLAWALLRLYETGGGRRYLEAAALIGERLFADFATSDGALTMTAADAGALIRRPVQAMDQTTPSANGMAARLAVGLYALSGEDVWRRHAEGILNAFAGLLSRAQGYAPMLLLAKAAYDMGTPKLTLAGDADGDLAQSFWGGWFPLIHLQHISGTRREAAFCAAGSCRPPVNDAAALAAELARLYPIQ